MEEFKVHTNVPVKLKITAGRHESSHVYVRTTVQLQAIASLAKKFSKRYLLTAQNVILFKTNMYRTSLQAKSI